jgi:hypothetical protein
MMLTIVQGTDIYPGGALTRRMNDRGISNPRSRERAQPRREMAAICSARHGVVRAG